MTAAGRGRPRPWWPAHVTEALAHVADWLDDSGQTPKWESVAATVVASPTTGRDDVTLWELAEAAHHAGRPDHVEARADSAAEDTATAAAEAAAAVVADVLTGLVDPDDPTTSPVAHLVDEARTAALAADPDEKAAHAAPPSNVVKMSSSCWRLGLPIREYTYPPGYSPSGARSNVVEGCMGASIAPDSGSIW